MSATPRKKRILLIQCGMDQRQTDRRAEGFEPELGLVQYAPMTPLACATLAALTPDDYEVEIWDEELRGQIRATTPLGRYDIVGVSVMYSALAYQARFLGIHFQGEGATVVAGGPAISAAPEEFRPYFDALFVNEAERTWPQFLRDWEAGAAKREYRQIAKPGLEESPPPRWCNVAEHVPRYEWASVQTTRGCPFDCEFCDVIYLYGRRQRHKPVGQVIDEVRALEALGARGIFFTDDEFVGNPAHARELLQALVPVNNGFRRALRCFTQVTMNLSRDAELLELMADANFYTVVLGVESFNTDSLRETRKHQNVRKDIVADIRTIQSYGIGPRGSFIVGFDHDGPTAFDAIHEGITRACIPWIVVSPLHAPENTPLWARLRSEGRIARLRVLPRAELTPVSLNLIPRNMTRVELLEGYRDLVVRLYDWDAALARIHGWARMVRRPPRVNEQAPTRAEASRFLSEIERTWALSPREHALIGDLLDEALRAFPHLVLRVVFFLLKNHTERVRYLRRGAGYQAILDAERTGDLVIDRQPVLVPEAASAAVRAFFPALYARLHRSLPDDGAIAEAAREAIVDFIVRWGATFERMEPHHEAFLLELCDRAAAKRGGVPAAAAGEDETALLAKARRSRLGEAVLKDVRDELARIAGA